MVEQSSSANKLSIVIVNFNAGEFLINCLKSLQVKKEINFEVWVVDNASSDGSLEKAQKAYPKINYIVNKENLGFGSANNIALKQIKSEYILLLNPDSEVLPGTLPHMLKFMEENPMVGVSTCRVEKEDGLLDMASHRGFPTPWASLLYYFFKNDSLYHKTNQDMKKVHEIDAVAGAFLLTRKSVLEKVGYFDEDYFLYAEDLDICYRIKQAGFKIMYVPDVKIIHHKGISSGIKKHSQDVTTATDESKVRAYNSFYETMKIFYKKHMEKNYPFFINWLVYTGINLKWWLAKRNMHV